ncbi:MAG TPA: zf-HC2 domain-containing protein [Pyrinomonadaceae bacterium]
MVSNHVIRQLSAYGHGELTPRESAEVGAHLMACSRCRSEFEEIKLGIKLAEQLPEISAPDSLWADLQLLRDAQARDRDDVILKPQSKKLNLWQPRFAAIAAGLLLIIGLGAFWFSRNQIRPSWEVARLDGTPTIGSSAISDKGRLGVGQWLETDSNSRAKIEVGSIGQVEVEPNTRLRLLQTQPTEHRLELAHGKMSARIWAPPRLFFVDTPSAVAADLGCAYTLEVDDQGGSLLRVTTGWVALQLKDRESMVPAGAACQTRPGIGPGTPYFEDASESFRTALAKLDFESGATDRSKTLESLLGDSRVRDTLTLWHLLARVEGVERAQVYGRMAELAPPPAGVTREGVLALNQQMLDTWKDNLESSWGDYSSPAMKALKKVWTSGLGRVHRLEGKR